MADGGKIVKWGFYLQVVAILVAILVPLIVWRMSVPAKLDMEIGIVEVRNLTQLSHVDGLDAKWYYRGTSISNFWMAQYKVMNRGSGTIIGIGNKSNLLRDTIRLYPSSNIRILGVNNKQLDIVSAVRYNDAGVVEVAFDQLCAGESFSFELFFEFRDRTEDRKILSLRDRPIADGVCQVTEMVSTEKAGGTKSFTAVYFVMLLIQLFMIVSVAISVVLQRKQIKRHKEEFQRVEMERDNLEAQADQLRKLVASLAREKDSIQE